MLLFHIYAYNCKNVRMGKLELGNGTGNLESSPYAKFTEEVGIM